MILTLVCLSPDKYSVVHDEGYVEQYRGIKLPKPLAAALAVDLEKETK